MSHSCCHSRLLLRARPQDTQVTMDQIDKSDPIEVVLRRLWSLVHDRICKLGVRAYAKVIAW